MSLIYQKMIFRVDMRANPKTLAYINKWIAQLDQL